MIDLQGVGAGDVDAQVGAPATNLTVSFVAGVPVSDLQVQTGPPPPWQSDVPRDTWLWGGRGWEIQQKYLQFNKNQIKFTISIIYYYIERLSPEVYEFEGKLHFG